MHRIKHPVVVLIGNTAQVRAVAGGQLGSDLLFQLVPQHPIDGPDTIGVDLVGTCAVWSGLVLGLAVAEVDVAGHDLGAAAFVPIPVGPVLELELPVDDRHAALGKISGHEVGGVALGHDVDKIRGLVAVGVLVIPFAGNGEGRDRDAGLCTAELRVAHEAAHSDDVVQHSFFLHLRFYK